MANPSARALHGDQDGDDQAELIFHHQTEPARTDSIARAGPQLFSVRPGTLAMPISPRAVSLALLLGAFMGAEASPADTKPLDVATVAKRPAPGTVVPGNFEYTPDCSAVSYPGAGKMTR